MADITSDAVLAMLHQQIRKAGTQKAAAAELGISQSYLNDILQGNREPAEKILAALGLERVVTYRKKEAADVDAQ